MRASSVIAASYLFLLTPLVVAGDLETLQTLDARVIRDDDAAAAAREALRREVRAGLNAANQKSSAEWYAVKSTADWESFRDERLARLRRSLSQDSLPTEPREVQVTGTITGDGFAIDNVVFTSRPGVYVTANLYRPQSPGTAMPGIVICHSHHAPKTQSELQTMGMTWARQGAVVLVMDQLGHGERRTHSFGTAGRYSGEYRPERQDYYFRYNTGLQLALVGESLMGWMVGDLMCGATLVADQPGVDAGKLVLLGAVAGGGDPAGVTGALDPRFAVVAPFNYGGYEPEDVFPLPDDAEQTFDYAGSGSWESTRNLRRSAADGFLPWTVIGSIAPRGVIYSHEFRWDEPRDPVWKRLQAIVGRYDASDKLASVVGRGTVKGRPPEASHCTNIGSIHRSQLYPTLERWIGLPAPTAEYDQRRESSELRCRATDEPFALHEVLGELADERLAAARRRRAGLDMPRLRAALRNELAPWLGDVDPVEVGADTTGDVELYGYVRVHRILTYANETHGRIPLPMLLVSSVRREPPATRTLVVAVAQAGKEAFLRERAELVAACIEKGSVVAIVDLRGTGETLPSGEGRGRQSGATSRSSSEQMLGATTIGRRVRDLRGVLTFLRAHYDLEGASLALYADGLVAPNADDRQIAAPLDAADLPTACEPGPALICLLTALWEDEVQTVATRGGLASYRSMLDGPYFYVPHDAIVPGLLTSADVGDLVAAQTARVKSFDERDAANRAIAPHVAPPSTAALTELLTTAADAQ